MRRGGGVIPPGKAGLIVIAAAMVPIAIKQFRPAVRWIGKKMQDLGEKVEKSADEVERYDREREAKNTAKREDVASKDENAATPPRETASPHGRAEVDAQKTKANKAEVSGPKKANTTKRRPLKGVSPPANNPKRARSKPDGPAV